MGASDKRRDVALEFRPSTQEIGSPSHSRFAARTFTIGFLVALLLVSGSLLHLKNNYYPWAPKAATFAISPFDETINPEWNRALDEAVNIWNSSSSMINITVDEKSENRVIFGELSEGEVFQRAQYRPKPLCGIGQCSFTITISERFQIYADDETISGLGVYLLAHELGHALGLADIPRNRAIHSIMAYHAESISRTPTERDIRLIETRLQVLSGDYAKLKDSFASF